VSGESAARVEALFRQAGAYRDGHFKLKSGRHGDRYIEKFEVLQWPDRVSELVRLMIDRVPYSNGRPAVDVVVGPTVGGVILAYEAARQLGVRGLFAEEVADETGATHRQLRRGFAIQSGERVMLVDDVITTGGSLLAMLPVVEEAGGELVEICVLVDRSGGIADIESPASGRRYLVDALWSLSLPTYEPGAATCPGCADAMLLKTPGSLGAKAAT
jgi:orotate phosphoribosyltransferase